MTDSVIINLPVQNLDTSKKFFLEIGFRLNVALTDENALCFDISPTTSIALLPNPHFAQATKTEVVDASKAHEVLLSVGKDSEQTVDSAVESAVKAGAVELHEPIRTSSMYGRSFADLDGHQWNFFYKS